MEVFYIRIYLFVSFILSIGNPYIRRYSLKEISSDRFKYKIFNLRKR